MDYLAARYVIGVRIRALHGDRSAQTPGGPPGGAAPDRKSHGDGPSRGSSCPVFRMYPRDAPKWGYHACWLTPVLSENSRAAYVRAWSSGRRSLPQ